jgi:transposase InsO family protein
MAYTKNPALPRVRRDAAELVRKGWSTRKVARHFGFSQGAIVQWCKKATVYGYNLIPTHSSKPKTHPKRLSREMVKKIVTKRLELRRSSEVIHRALIDEGVQISLSSVKRTLDRQGLIKKQSPWKRLHVSPPRPVASLPGDLVQVDTVHLMRRDGTRVYVFTGIDVRTRYAHAWATERANTRTAVCFVRRMKKNTPFGIRMLQSDNGSEFSTSFTDRVRIEHRHSRVRRPNDNAHLERFNRTLREECLNGLPTDIRIINRTLPKYLRYYNEKRHHFGLNLETPLKVITSY